jgi:hypothetical protein
LRLTKQWLKPGKREDSNRPPNRTWSFMHCHRNAPSRGKRAASRRPGAVLGLRNQRCAFAISPNTLTAKRSTRASRAALLPSSTVNARPPVITLSFGSLFLQNAPYRKSRKI